MKLGTRVRMQRAEPYLKKHIKKGSKLLDIGAGNGYITDYICKMCSCKAHCADIIDYLEFDFPFTLIKKDSLDLPSNKFDVAIINDSLHHMEPSVQRKMLLEATRVARKVIIIETKRTFIAMFLDSIFSRIQHFDMPIPYTHKTSKGWKMLFEELDISCKEENVKRDWYYPLQHLFFVVERRR